MSKYPAGHPRRVKSRDRESLDRLEQMGLANPPLFIYCLHDDRRLQLCLYGIGKPPAWIVYLPLPLFLMLFTGLYMFVLPYAAKWRARQIGG